MVQKAFKKLEGVDINMIAATHGPIWRSDVNKIIDLYNKWSKFETEEGVVIIFGSMYGNTEKMADYLARRISEQGIKNIRVRDASKTHLSHLINDIWRFKGVLLGSAAYNSAMHPNMEHLTRTLEHMKVKNHILGLFGSFSWNGGGVKTLKKFAENIEWEMAAEPLEIKGIPTEEELNEGDELAKQMAARVKE
jgi:flavorubredoxin